ncbi:MAG: hypothetical protein KC620_17405 [Myxococcales bacterium]|nr:hypothetical protein [Myxococcales bacterium]
MNRYVKTLIAAAGCAALFASPAMAGRRTALAGNQLITDKDDTFIFPQLLLKYRNLIGFDYGGSSDQGSGMLLLGSQTFGFGILVNRTDVNGGFLGENATNLLAHHMRDYEVGNLGAPASPLNSNGNGVGIGPFLDPKTMVDVLLAMDLGSSLLGFRLGFGQGLQFQDINGNDSTNSLVSLKLSGGLSFGRNMDLAADLVFASSENTDVQTGALFGLNANLRGFSPMGDKIDLGYLAQLSFANQSLTSEGGDKPADTRLDLILMGGAGPVYHLNKMNSTIAAYGILAIAYTSRDPNTEADDNETTALQVILPGVRMSYELYLTEWLAFRTGMEYTFVFDNRTEAAGDNTFQERKGDFGWNAGIGLVFEDFKLDAAFSHSWITAGPDFLGGDGNMFTIVSASYSF